MAVMSPCSMFIIRLECQSFATFNVSYNDQYYKEQIIKRMEPLSSGDCATYCVMHRKFFFFNYGFNSKKCELLTSSENKTDEAQLEEKTGWTFFSTDFNITKVVSSIFVSINLAISLPILRKKKVIKILFKKSLKIYVVVLNFDKNTISQLSDN